MTDKEQLELKLAKNGIYSDSLASKIFAGVLFFGPYVFAIILMIKFS